MKVLAFLFALALPAAAQPTPKFQSSKPAPEQASANKALAERVALELQELTGYNFTREATADKPASEGRVMIDAAARNMKSGNEAEIQHWLVEPMLGFIAMMDPQKAISAEHAFWRNRGYNFSRQTKEKAQKAYDQAVLSSPGASDANSSSRQAGFKAYSEVLISEPILPKAMAWYQSALMGYRQGQIMIREYKMDSDNQTYRTAQSIRDVNLGNLGFKNKSKFVMATFGNPELMPPGDGVAEGGHKRLNALMFTGLLAPIVYEGVHKGLYENDPPSKAELKAAMNEVNAQYGFQLLGDFAGGIPAALVGKLRDQALEDKEK